MTSVDQAFLKAFARPATPRPNLAAERRVTLAAAICARAKAVQEPEAARVAVATPAAAPLAERAEVNEPRTKAAAAPEPKAPNSIAQALAARLERITAAAESPAVLPMPTMAATETTSPEASEPSPGADSAEPILRFLRPALRLERFPWPASVTRLNKSHAGQLDGVVKTLLTAQRDGKKVIGLIAQSRGEGTSTVTLAVVRRLSDGKLRVAVADGDWAHPQLARRLALLSEGGWEAVLARRRTLAEAMVESADGQLAVLPCVAAPAIKDKTAAEIDETLDVLRQNYDLVLIDLPPAADAASPLWPKLDAAVIVQHADRAGEEEIAAVRKRLVAAGVEVLGVVQNCVTE